MAEELPKAYEPSQFHDQILNLWLDSKASAAIPDERPPEERYVIMMPLPNVTGALHMGHAMDNVMQDLLTRWNRMKGKNTLWQPGTDHAGIATQAVVEKRLFELEGKTRHELGREALVERIWEWKDSFQKRIVSQQQAMGCSCDWDRQRFTMDPVCTKAVRETFFKLFRDQLIYRGNRLVNWDCKLQTAVADDEVYHEKVEGHFWHLRYPVVDPKSGEPDHVLVATTRPETMLGDTAVACHPDPRKALQARIAEQEEKLAQASEKDRESAEEELQRLKSRLETHIPGLEMLRDMALDGRRITLPLTGREIPLITDEWAKPELGSGCVKITPGHDPNDYEVWTRHADEIEIINLLRPDGTYNSAAGDYEGLDRFEVRSKLLDALKTEGLLEKVEDRIVEIGHSDRSKTPIEPYLSKQWFVRMGDVPGGIEMGGGTARTFKAPGLAQAAIDAVSGNDYFPTEDRLEFHPERYTSQYVNWLAEKRDWCISRQLWWGHRIPAWIKRCETLEEVNKIVAALPQAEDLVAWVSADDGNTFPAEALPETAVGPYEVQVSLRNAQADENHGSALESLGMVAEDDVLDTWFSSALWPFSTLGWPDADNAPVEEGQQNLGKINEHENSFDYYYPGSCLVTARDIISLWVARMVIMGLYNHGRVPFSDSFIHAKILDGKGVTMSKSKGNGVDPVDIIERYGVDAMRYLICDMETGLQDVRLPVQAECPACKEEVEHSEAKHGKTIFTYLCTKCKSEFDVLGTLEDVPSATAFSNRFETGRQFCNKLYNAVRFALMNLGELGFTPLSNDQLEPEDRWILSKLNSATAEVTKHLENYAPSMAIGAARDFFWSEVCDWYLELIKPRMWDDDKAPIARQVLATLLDQVIRLLHPFVPFITEALWGYLNQAAPVRGIKEALPASELCIKARWPSGIPGFTDPALEQEFEVMKTTVGTIRELRSRYRVSPAKKVPTAIQVSGQELAILKGMEPLIANIANLEPLDIGESVAKPTNAVTQIAGSIEVMVGDLFDPAEERERLETRKGKIEKQLEGCHKKLGNKNFVDRAPAEVIETERARVAEFERELEVIAESLAEM